MAMDRFSRMQRRAFLKLTGAMAAFRLTPPCPCGSQPAGFLSSSMATIRLPAAIRSIGPQASLRNALVAKGFLCDIVPSPDQRKGSTFSDRGGRRAQAWRGISPRRATASAIRRAFVSFPDIWQELPATLVSASGQRGFIYGLLELAERVQFSPEPGTALRLSSRSRKSPRTKSEASLVRSAARSKISPGTTTRISGEAIWICSWPAASIASTSLSEWATTFLAE